MRDSRIKIFAFVLAGITLAILVISFGNVSHVFADGMLSYATVKGRALLTTKEATAELRLTLSLTLLLQFILCHQIFYNKRKIWLITIGNVLLLLYLLFSYTLFVTYAGSHIGDAVYLYFLPAGCNLSAIALDLLYKIRNKFLAILFILLITVTAIPAILLLLNSRCVYWRENGHHVEYYSNGQKYREYTLDCGDYRNEKIEWNENGTMKNYLHYNHNGVVDSFAEFDENGKLINTPLKH